MYVDSAAGGGAGVAASSSGLHGQGLGEGIVGGGDGDGGSCSVGYTAVMSASLQVTPLRRTAYISPLQHSYHPLPQTPLNPLPFTPL